MCLLKDRWISLRAFKSNPHCSPQQQCTIVERSLTSPWGDSYRPQQQCFIVERSLSCYRTLYWISATTTMCLLKDRWISVLSVMKIPMQRISATTTMCLLKDRWISLHGLWKSSAMTMFYCLSDNNVILLKRSPSAWQCPQQQCFIVERSLLCPLMRYRCIEFS